MYNFNKFGLIMVEKIVNKKRFSFSDALNIFKKQSKDGEWGYNFLTFFLQTLDFFDIFFKVLVNSFVRSSQCLFRKLRKQNCSLIKNRWLTVPKSPTINRDAKIS